MFHIAAGQWTEKGSPSHRSDGTEPEGAARCGLPTALVRTDFGQEPHDLFFHFKDETKKKQIALVGTQDFADLSGVNLEQLRAGLAHFVDPGPALDWWQTCHYRRAETEARQARRGLWQDRADRQ